MGHYGALFLAYATALLGWVLVHETLRRAPRVQSLWGAAAFDPEFRRPWIELGLVLTAAVAVVGIGQIYMAGFRLPTDSSLVGTLSESMNQLAIFSPITDPIEPPRNVKSMHARITLRPLMNAVPVWTPSL